VQLSTLREESTRKEAELSMSGTEASKRISELNAAVADLQKEIVDKVRRKFLVVSFCAKLQDH
jgi:hypothetical protein